VLRRAIESRHFGATLLGAALVGLIAAGSIVAGDPAKSHATTPARPAGVGPADLELDLVRQSATTPLGGTLELRLELTGPIGADDNLEIQVIAHPKIESLEDLVETSGVDDIEGFKDSVEFDLAELARFSDGDVLVPVDLQPPLDDGDSRDFTKLNTTVAGVYPIEIAARDAEESVLARTITWLVATDPAGEPTVELAWLWRFQPAPLVEADGVTPTPEFVAETHAGGAIESIVDQLEGVDDPVTVELSPQMVDAWARAAGSDPDAAASFERLQTAVRDRPITLLAAPYVPVHGPDLEAGELGPRLAASFLDGAQTLQANLSVRPPTDLVAAEPIDPPSLARLGDAFAYRVIVAPTSVTPDPPADQFVITTGGRQFQAIATRPDLQAILEPGYLDIDPTIGRHVQYLIATLALESAGRAEPLPVVFDDRVDPRMRSALGAAVGDESLVDVVAANRLFDDEAPESRAVRSVDAQNASVSALEIIDAERVIAAFAEFVGPDDPAVAAAEANLRLAVARDIQATEMRERLQELDRAASTFVAGIATESKTVTLTDRRSEIPLSFRNDTDRDVEVRVTLSSSKLVFPDGPERVIALPAGRTTQETFLVEARASGTFAMQVRMTSTDGNLDVGGTTQITVRSAVFGSIGTWLTFGALGFLALWWAHHFWRTRRRTAAA
jgi:Family of unknown function (DUF6049)